MCQKSKFLEKEVYPDFPERAQQPNTSNFIFLNRQSLYESKIKLVRFALLCTVGHTFIFYELFAYFGMKFDKKKRFSQILFQIQIQQTILV
jgi:hypothetical protein